MSRLDKIEWIATVFIIIAATLVSFFTSDKFISDIGFALFVSCNLLFIYIGYARDQKYIMVLNFFFLAINGLRFII